MLMYTVELIKNILKCIGQYAYMLKIKQDILDVIRKRSWRAASPSWRAQAYFLQEYAPR